MFDKTLARIGASLEKAGIPYMIIGEKEWLKTFDAASDERNFLVTFREIAGSSRI